MNVEQYRDKVLACWNGKNAGGCLGEPFELKRGLAELDYYTQELNGEPLPNDDLDLQLVWLCAAEKYGANITSEILAEYWLRYIVPNWSEYGNGKTNLRRGFLPPLSGHLRNDYKDSNGAFILTEIWACLCPGRPDLAAEYAYRDSSVNHSGEGIYAAVFTAALESAAFTVSDRDELLRIAKTYLPDECGVRSAIETVEKSYASGRTWKEAYFDLMSVFPGSFGMNQMETAGADENFPAGPKGYDAPNAIGIVVLGWLYGEGDFSKSICIAAGCMEDGDCTAGTLGALLGIIGGNASIPAKWLEPLGGKIKTKCMVNCDKKIKYPKTTEELTDRVIALLPRFLGQLDPTAIRFPAGFEIDLPAERAAAYAPRRVNAWYHDDRKSVWSDPLRIDRSCPLFNAELKLDREPLLGEGETMQITLTVDNASTQQQWIEGEWTLPRGIVAEPCTSVSFPLTSYHCNVGRETRIFRFTVTPDFATEGILKLDLRAKDHVCTLHAELPIMRDCK